MLDRVPPQNLEAEQSTLGSMMIEPTALLKGMEILTAEDFYRPAHQEVFAALCDLSRKDEPADLRTLQEALRKRDKLEEIGGTEYLFALVESVPTAANIRHYAEIVREKADRRRVIGVATEAIGFAMEEEEGDAVAFLAERALALGTGRTVVQQSMRQVAETVWGELEQLEQGVVPPVVPFTLTDLNQILNGGGRNGQLGVISAESSQGKSCLMLDAVIGAAKQHTPALVVSYEMSNSEMVKRILYGQAEVDAYDVQPGEVPFDKLSAVIGDVTDYNVTWIDQVLTLPKIEAIARQWKLKEKNATEWLLVIDYAQLIPRTGRAQEENVIADRLYNELKAIARRLGAFVLTASQIRKQPAGQGKNRYEVEDMNLGYGCRLAHLRVLKNRNGRTGDSAALFREPWTRFDNLDHDSLFTACRGRVPFHRLDDLLGSGGLRNAADIVIDLYNPPMAERRNSEEKALWWGDDREL